MTTEFNPHRFPEHMLPAVTAELSAIASEALQLAAILDDPEGAPVAALFRRYLERANDLAEHHRLGPRRLAQEMLDELDALEA
jgi:hypothetical protein